MKSISGFIAAVALLLPFWNNVASAQTLIMRPALQPVKSLEGQNSAMDTIDTANPAVKIILYDDNTWQYWKHPDFALLSDTFSRNWDNLSVDPYHVSLDQLEDRVTFWLVDSLSAYRCPYQTKVYSPFGYRHGRRHMGVDLPLKTGQPVYAAFSGRVRLSKVYRGYGNLVVIRHENGLETFYGHLSKRLVEAGDWVSAGDVIGLGGSTGRSTGPHLHFEVRYQGYAFDPQWVIDFESGILRHRAFVLKKKYLSAASKYVPETETEDDEIMEADSLDKAAAAKALKQAAEAAKRYHTVRKGETLSVIARKEGTTVAKICKLNGITTKTVLKIGRKLRVK